MYLDKAVKVPAGVEAYTAARIEGDLDTSNPGGQLVGGYRFDFSGTTAIESVETESAAPAVYYDLSGRRVENPTKGIYIVNGRKVLIK